MSAVTQDVQKTIFACLMHAHIINAEKPGAYQDTINKVFPANNLAAIIIPEALFNQCCPAKKKNQKYPRPHTSQQTQVNQVETELTTHTKKTEDSTKP